MDTLQGKTALITGAARRIGAIIAEALHTKGYRVIIHYRQSKQDAEALCETLNTKRSNSAITAALDLNHIDRIPAFLEGVIQPWGRLDVLINNASSFYPTKIGDTTEAQWQDLINSNLTAPYFLIQAATPYLKKSKGSVVNISDINARKPLKNYPVYSIAKAGLNTLSQALAQELAPDIRVNAIAPSKTLWPEGENALSDSAKQQALSVTALKRLVDPQDIAKATLFLLQQTSMTGEILYINNDLK